jgi:hypothetical protein
MRYIASFFKQKLPNLRSGYGYGVQLLAKVPSLENTMLLEGIVFDKTLHRDERQYALETLIRLNSQTGDNILSQILSDPNEEEGLREATVPWLIRRNQRGQKEMLLSMLLSEETPHALRLTIAAGLVQRHAQEVLPLLWELFQRQKKEPITRENSYLCLRPLLLLLEQNEKKAIQEILELLENIDNDIWSIFPGKDEKIVAYLRMTNDTYFTPFSKRIAEKLVDQADLLTLSTFCFNRQIHFLIRRDFIRQIAQMGKKGSAFIPLFLENLADCTDIEDIRVALAEAFGELAMDEQAVVAGLYLYQKEPFPRVKDALYTALSKVTRRANVIIVPDRSDGGVLRLVRR